MPLYEFECQSCEHAFEELVIGSETVQCPTCASENLRKLVSGFAVGDVNAVRGSASIPNTGSCGTCGDPAGPGACSLN